MLGDGVIIMCFQVWLFFVDDMNYSPPNRTVLMEVSYAYIRWAAFLLL